MPLGWAQKRVKRRQKRKEKERGGAEAHLSPALEGPLGKGVPRRAANAERGVVRPGRGASVEARGVSAGSAVPVRGSAARRLREASGSLPGVQGSRKTPPEDTPSPGSAQTPGFSAQRAGCPRAQAPRPKLGHGDGDPNAVHPLWRSPWPWEEPQSRGPQPRRLDPAPATGTKGNKTSCNPPHAFGETLPAAARAQRIGGTLGRGRAGGHPSPYQTPAASGAATSRLLRLPFRGFPLRPPPPALPSEVTETFSCSGEGGVPLPTEGGGTQGGSHRGRGRGSWTLTRRTEAGRSERGAREVGADRG